MEEPPGRHRRLARTRVRFSRTERFAGTIVWRYQLEPDGTGTRLTESYHVTRPITRLGWFVIAHLYGGRDRRTDLRTGMQQTLQRIRETAERDVKPDRTAPDKQQARS